MIYNKPDFIKVTIDSKNIAFASGCRIPSYTTLMGNPCDEPEPFKDLEVASDISCWRGQYS